MYTCAWWVGWRDPVGEGRNGHLHRALPPRVALFLCVRDLCQCSDLPAMMGSGYGNELMQVCWSGVSTLHVLFSVNGRVISAPFAFVAPLIS